MTGIPPMRLIPNLLSILRRILNNIATLQPGCCKTDSSKSDYLISNITLRVHVLYM
jgi:hypothetical protein